MFKWNRILVALIGVPLLVFIYTDTNLQGIPLLIFSFFVVGVGLNEFYKMVKASGREVYGKFGTAIGLLIVFTNYQRNFVEVQEKLQNEFWFSLSFYYNKLGLNYTNILMLTVILLLVYRVFRNQIKGTLDSVAFTVLGLIYVAIFFSEIISLYFSDYYYYEISGFGVKPISILYLQILVWVSDTSAGIVGMGIGRKFFKNGFTEISPKKSVEGAIGSLLFTGLAAIIIAIIELWGNSLRTEELFYSFLFGVVISFVAQLGDLIESLFKRECGIKDSGTILMGHGGILDRFDSMLLVLPFVSLLLSLVK